jgi:hypothetical protein
MQSDPDLLCSDDDVLRVQLRDEGFPAKKIDDAIALKQALDALTPEQRAAMAEAPGKN